MSQDQPAPVDTDVDRADGVPAVVEWGGDRPTGRTSRWFTAIRADPRPPRLLAGLALAILCGSLLTDWRTWTIQQTTSLNEETTPQQRFLTGVVSFPTVGTGYLIGLLVLAGCLALAFAGTGPVRHNSRLLGLATTGVLFVVLVTATTHIDQLGGSIEDFAMPRGTDADGMRIQIEYGPGLYLAYLGVVVMALALFLVGPVPADRHRRGPRPIGAAVHPDRDGEAEPGPDGAGDWADRKRPAPVAAWDEDDSDGWAWRPGSADRSGPEPAGPVDLTVEPTAPFLPPPDGDGRT